jgi:phosphatidylglycerophosphate synthase
MSQHKNPIRKNIFEAIYNIPSKFLSKYIVKTSYSPNQITIFSGLLGILGSFFLTSSNYFGLFLAAILLNLYCILDAVDGDIARMKGMQSFFGKWLDIFFDKLNDFFIILGLSVGVYFQTNNIISLYLGIILMGLVFFIQFSMVVNSNIISECENTNKNNPNKQSENILKKYQKNSLINKVRKIIDLHLLLNHCAFLMIVTFFSLINQLEFGLWFITVYAFLTFIYIIISSGLKIQLIESID